MTKTTYNWVDHSGNQMVDSDGNSLVFYSELEIPVTVRVARRMFVVRKDVSDHIAYVGRRSFIVRAKHDNEAD